MSLGGVVGFVVIWGTSSGSSGGPIHVSHLRIVCWATSCGAWLDAVTGVIPGAGGSSSSFASSVIGLLPSSLRINVVAGSHTVAALTPSGHSSPGPGSVCTFVSMVIISLSTELVAVVASVASTAGEWSSVLGRSGAGSTALRSVAAIVWALLFRSRVRPVVW